MGNFFSQFTDAQIKWVVDSVRSDFLDGVKTHIKTGVCIDYKQKMLYLPLVWDQKMVDIGKKLGVNHNTVRSAVHKMSCDLFEKFGQDFFSDVDTDLQFAVDRFNMVKNFNGLDTFFIDGFLPLIAGLVDDETAIDPRINMLNSQDEIHFLKNYTAAGVSDEIKGFNRDSIRYILSVLAGNGSGELRYNLANYMIRQSKV